MKRYFRTLSLFCLVVITFALYLNGVSGNLYYDDFSFFARLAQYSVSGDFWGYIFDGQTSVTGRPISLASFYAQGLSIENQYNKYFEFNILLHGLNSFLVYLLTKQLLIISKTKVQVSYQLVAFLVAILWCVLPIHVSTILVAVQRMALLSGFFVLLALNSYLYGCFLLIEKKRLYRAYFWQYALPAILMMFAILSKENGVLVLGFILILETTIFKRVESLRVGWQRKIRVFIPALILAGLFTYLFFRTINTEAYSFRDFSMSERLLVQPSILIEYLRVAFLPTYYEMSPFNDHFSAFRIDNAPFYIYFSFLLILSLVTFTVINRLKYPLLSFSVLWFIIAHSLESSFISLELYFEHRNYIALIGPCVLIVLSVLNVSFKSEKIIKVLLVLYILFLAITVFQAANVWGDKKGAAEQWFFNEKGSSRASENLALIYLEEGRTLDAWKVIEMQIDICENCTASKIQGLLLACVNKSSTRTSQLYSDITNSLRLQVSSSGSASAISGLAKQVNNGNCSLLNSEDVYELAALLLKYPTEQLREFDKLTLLFHIYDYFKSLENNTLAEKALLDAWRIKKDINIATLIVRDYIRLDYLEKASDFIQTDACKTIKIKDCQNLNKLVIEMSGRNE